MRSLLKRARRIYALIDQYGTLTDSPTERLKGLLFTLFAGEGLPNILLGLAISATITSAFGDAPASVAVAGWAFFALALVNYIVAQELIVAAQAASQEFQDDDPRGIY